ncbi:MAG: fatty acid desaturase [Melioribacteraceae bacterium]|nr:fatty acid desaturase [Melioribacteraceae bacterium]
MGLLIAFLVVGIWGTHLYYALSLVTISLSNPWMYFHILLQGYLYTGLFITAHDAMHGIVVPKNKFANQIIGTVSSLLFAGMSYKRLIKNHFDHHRYPGTDKDPDFYVKSQNPLVWWAVFMFRYTTITQLIFMAVVFNLLKFWFPEINIWLMWVIPAFLGSVQLFFFGTYLPHRKPHDENMVPHNARTQRKNHIWAMISCYFFGYHFEHHDAPNVPWWQLYKTKS